MGQFGGMFFFFLMCFVFFKELWLFFEGVSVFDCFLKVVCFMDGFCFV